MVPKIRNADNKNIGNISDELKIVSEKSRNLKRAGTTWPRSNFAEVASGFGCRSWKVDNLEDYKVALDESSKIKGAKLIDVWVDPDGYADQLKSLRG